MEAERTVELAPSFLTLLVCRYGVTDILCPVALTGLMSGPQPEPVLDPFETDRIACLYPGPNPMPADPRARRAAGGWPRDAPSLSTPDVMREPLPGDARSRV